VRDERLGRGAGRDGKISLDVAAETVEIGFEDRRLLGVGERAQPVALGPAASSQGDFSGDLRVADPLGVATGCDQVELAAVRSRSTGNE
jgi:hypothetical protein